MFLTIKHTNNMNIYLLCLIVFFVRIIDTSLGTVRMILTVRNMKKFAVLISFFEVLVWFIVVRAAINDASGSILVALSYSAGYATGVLIGMSITNKYMLNNIIINAIIHKKNRKVIKELVDNGFALSVSNVKGKDLLTTKYMLRIVTISKNLKVVKDIINSYENNAFLVVYESKQVINGYL